MQPFHIEADSHDSQWRELGECKRTNSAPYKLRRGEYEQQPELIPAARMDAVCRLANSIWENRHSNLHWWSIARQIFVPEMAKR